MTEHYWRLQKDVWKKKVNFKKLTCLWASLNEGVSSVASVSCNYIPKSRKSCSKGQEWTEVFLQNQLKVTEFYLKMSGLVLRMQWNAQRIFFFKVTVMIFFSLSATPPNLALSGVFFWISTKCTWVKAPSPPPAEFHHHYIPFEISSMNRSSKVDVLMKGFTLQSLTHVLCQILKN